MSPRRREILVAGGAPKSRKEELDQGPDGDRIERRPDTDRPAEQEPGDKHRHLDPGPNEPDAEPGPLDQGDPDAVAWPGAQPRADVERSGHAVADDTNHQQRDPSPHRTGCGNERDARVGGQPDEENVEHSANARPLLQRDPQQQDDRAHDDDHLAEGEWDMVRQTFVKDVPGVQAEPGLDHEGHREAVKQEADDQLREARSHHRFRFGSKGSNGRPVIMPRPARAAAMPARNATTIAMAVNMRPHLHELALSEMANCVILAS